MQQISLRRITPSAAASALRTTDSGLLSLALVVGAGAGGGAVLFRWLIKVFTEILSGHPDYSAAGHAANPHVEFLGRWFVVLAPVVAGLIYGPLVQRFAREARGHGVPEVMYAVARQGGRIKPQVAAVKAIASALCIGGGGSVGREGPIVQIGSALGSTLGGIVRVAESRRRVLVACGAAGGIAATFNAPLAGVFFAMELILRDFTAQAFGMVVLSSVTSSVIGRAAFGDKAFLHLPSFTVRHGVEYPLFAVLGLLAGVVGVGFTRVLYGVEDLCDKVWHGPEWLRPAVGGIVLGLVLLLLPEMYGVGYPVLIKGAQGGYVLGFLLVLLVGKMVATSLSIGIGGSGGVFAPSLFIGAMAGAAYGDVLHTIMPGLAGPVGAYALIGMGAVFAGAARAPITAVIIMFELTGEYSIILPLMAAIVLAAGISHLLSPDTIYTLKLRRRGVDIDATPSAPLTRTVVGSVMQRDVRTVGLDEDVTAVAATLAEDRHGQLVVVDEHGAYQGVLVSRDVTGELMNCGDTTGIASVLRHPVTVAVDDTLDRTLAALGADESAAVPVLAADGRTVVGWLTDQDLLSALRPPRGPATAAGPPASP